MPDNAFSQYKDLFLQTGKEYLQSLNTALLALEKNPTDKTAIADIFRSAHSLKSQSAAMGYEKTGYLCHAVEDVFYEIKEGRKPVTPELDDQLFKAFDALTASLGQIEKDGTEIDVTAQVEALKQLTGITTQGAGKTARPAVGGPDPGAAPAPEPAPATPEPVAAPPTPSPAAPSAPPATAAPDATPAPSETPSSAEAAPTIKTIPVKVEQLDDMMNLLEELLVHDLALKRLARKLDSDELRNYYDQAQRLTEALQFQIMKIRAVPVNMIFAHFPRAVRDLARVENKRVDLVIEGGDLELDRTLVERLDEPLIHIIRNAVDHGIGPSGTIRLTARREKDYAVVEVADNGAGVDWAAVAKKGGVTSSDPAVLKKLLFSGLSTSEQVTQVSGRGVGLQVVKKTIEDFGGSIDVDSQPGHGTTFIIKLPLTLAVMRALLVQVGEERYAIPASTIDRSVRVAGADIQTTAGVEAFVLDAGEVPLVRLAHTLAISAAEVASAPADSTSADVLVVIVSLDNERIGLVVDEAIEVSELVVKPVPDVLRGQRAFAGTTILGDGRSALILNPRGLV